MMKFLLGSCAAAIGKVAATSPAAARQTDILYAIDLFADVIAAAASG